MNWHLLSCAKGLIVSGVLILVVIGLPMGFALNRTGDEMKQDVSIMTCNIGDIVGGNPLDSDEVAGFIRDCGVPDVLLLQEVRGEKEAAYLSRQLNRPAAGRSGNCWHGWTRRIPIMWFWAEISTPSRFRKPSASFAPGSMMCSGLPWTMVWGSGSGLRYCSYWGVKYRMIIVTVSNRQIFHKNIHLD